MNPGEVIKQNGKVMIYLFGEEVKKCLALNEHGRVEVIRVEGEVEPVKYEHLTTFFRNRLLLLNAKHGGDNADL